MTDNRYGNVPSAPTVEEDDSSDDETSLLTEQNDVKSYTANQKWKWKMMEIVKFLAYPIVFILVLCSGVVAKGTVLFMTSQLRPNRSILYCNRLLHRDKTFVVTSSEEENIAWIWCIIFAFTVPEILTLIRSVSVCLLQSWKLPNPEHFLLVILMETFHVVGLAIMFMIILPELDIIQGAMLTNCVCFVPGLLGLLSRNKERDGLKRFMFTLMDVVALAGQMMAFIVWPLLDISNSTLWLLPVALFLVSCSWWENYVSVHSPLSLIKALGKVKEEMNLTRNFTYVLVSFWKIVTFFLSSVLILHLKSDTGFTYLFTMFKSAFSSHNITVTELQLAVGGGTIPNLSDVLQNGITVTMITEPTFPIYVLLMQILSAYFAYVCGKFACKILIQGFGYALPITITVPVLISILIFTGDLRNGDPCFFHGVIPDYLFYESLSFSILTDFWVWLIWLFSQTWIILHIFTPKCERPEFTDKLFVTPYYNGLLIDQSMGLNRKRDDQPYEDSRKTSRKNEEDDDNEAILQEPRLSTVQQSDVVTKIYACATMWHETKKEMSEFLKSIIRLDKHQCAMKNYQECLTVASPDFFELETHIFFDGAFKKSEYDKNVSVVNKWVTTFIKVLHETAFNETKIPIEPPKRCPTPYGGRLIWTLPGNTKMFVHLKDSSQIRRKKRWSQVMYMYYLLQHRITDQRIPESRKKAIAENTFLLALDGDIIFEPSAVKLLVDLMKKDENLGAACGRIHPVGSGPMVWFQKFEYAIGHWLQKATEHMIGCVLCSPGCFSLFRAKALMRTDVLKTYTTRSREARHYVQYDQGEDRWLCTLLLKSGYRVEYSAASDSWTHAPEGFFEFFKQRRRWLPSTMANIIDLLLDHTRVVEKNNNISTLYVLYQLLLMVGTILGPGTIFLMLIGASCTAFRIDIWTSFYSNTIPILLFIAICFTCSAEIQLFAALVISLIYSIVMMAVVVGIFLQVIEDSWLAPSSIFLFLVIAQIAITGFLHPQELDCLPCGVIYYLTIPSMYLLLVIYSIANLNDSSWGTRVVPSDETDQKSEQGNKDAEKVNGEVKPDSSISSEKNNQGSAEFSLTGLFKRILCIREKSTDEQHHLATIAKSLESLKKRFDTVERLGDPKNHVSGQRHVTFKKSQSTQTSMHPDIGNSNDDHSSDSDSDTTISQNTDGNLERASLINPYWLEDDKLKEGEVDYLTTREEKFWEDLIKKYLFPIYEDEKKKKRVDLNLKELRNKCFVTFFMLNALFVTIVFLLQLNQDLLHIKWPLGSKSSISYDRSSQEVHIAKNHLQLEPIGLAFVAFFGVILVIQFTAMLFHRLGTFTHILANTTLRDWGYCCKKPKNRSRREFLIDIKDEMVEELERFAYTIDHSQRRAFGNASSGRGGSSKNRTLDHVFREGISRMSQGAGFSSHMSPRKSTLVSRALQEINQPTSDLRRTSQVQTNGRNNSNLVNSHSFRQPGPSTSTLSPITEARGSLGHINDGFEMEESRSSTSQS